MTLTNVQNGQIKNGSIPDKEDEDIPCNKLCVYLIGTLFIRRNGKKWNLNIIDLTMIETITV